MFKVTCCLVTTCHVVTTSVLATVDARTLQRLETLEQSFLQHQQQVQTQLESMQVCPLCFCTAMSAPAVFHALVDKRQERVSSNFSVGCLHCTLYGCCGLMLELNEQN